MNFQNLVLKTHKLEQMYDFYRHTLQLPEAASYASDRFTVYFGATALTFVQSEQLAVSHCHYTVRIPEKSSLQAKEWIRLRMFLHNKGGYDDIFFPGHKKKSLYFRDPGGNVVELTAANDTGSRFKPQFSAADFLKIGEVTAVCDNVVRSANKLTAFGLPILGRAYKHFAAIGDHNGLIILKEPGGSCKFSNLPIQWSPINLTIKNVGTVQFKSKRLTLDKNSYSD
ncbi:VOC family protein [Salisediminibacterium halotolerans]|uniref:VOC family protein n=1 Tax=Salisediminibacterium halotolerans TaxID=517425 RepID=UPI000EB406D8|nr:VOC family protein [Salisediminibacterium halotolerans]RLJ71682.1 catechol-2,3-dioxygenase [Actinophytocola xinjiangensis]RPE86832.1 catechol-2,3-dioxygenase [Salisediminibacterium halotolerans]TWG32895.1 catechol-2,3-dioxygenase [Salisediminibacterium halotolerans]GEL07749.1 hypothetical protein SHA02_11650 [Salisediminibacterium halotolerans]